MANFSEEVFPLPENLSTRDVLQTFESLHKWRKEQLQTFLNNKLAENRKLLENSQENQRQFLEESKVTSHTSERISDENSFASNLTSNSTPTGHILRCFSDTSGDSLAFLKNEEHDKLNASAVRIKRPFLRKGSGLMRYMPKSSQQCPVSKCEPASKTQETISDAQANLKLKKNHHKAAFATSTAKSVHFEVPVSNVSNQGNHFETEPVSNSKLNHACFTVPDSDFSKQEIGFETKECSVSGGTNDECHSEILDETSTQTAVKCDIHLHQEHEKQELDEFELLESCAQNSSFNSDSSVVQRVLRGEPVLLSQNVKENPPTNSHVERVKPQLNKNSSNVDSPSPKIKLLKLSREILKKKQPIEDIIFDTDLRINKFRKETAILPQEIILETENNTSERCSTPIGQIIHQSQFSSPIIPEIDSSFNHLSSPVKHVLQINNGDSAIIDKDSPVNVPMKSYVDLIDGKDNVTSVPDSQNELKNSLDEKSILQAKRKELEREIEIYQALNAELSESCKERDEIARKLKKEYDGIEKYKEEEKNKLKTELENERRQLKREKETFHRYQKLRKDNPTRKEREELQASRQEVERLQEELKRQKIKYNNDTRRMKNQLVSAEKERDTLKLENITLEDQCQDLLHALKTRNLKIKKDLLILNKKSEVNENEKNLLNSISNLTANFQMGNIEIPEKNSMGSKSPTTNENDKLSSSLKPRVRFNLVPQFEKENQKDDLENMSSKEFEISALNESAKDATDDSGVESLNLLEFNESSIKEIKHADKIEKIYPSGNREVILPNGTRKIINIDEKTTKIMYYNGDIKDIYADKRVVYRYNSGEVETRYPCGLQVTAFPNGQVLSHFADGLQEVKFPDGTVQYIHSDGSEEIIAKDGTIVTIRVDGTEIIERKNGEKEIRTKTFKRREFLDGSVRILYDSGRKETRYSNGRIKIKDKNGKVIVDTKHLKG